MDITKAFRAVERRAAIARLTIEELCDGAQVDRTKYWRASKGKHKRADTRIKVLREVEGFMDRHEAARLICGLCDRRADDPATKACTHTDCGLTERRAA